jgi:hypothetical protein
MNAQSTSQQLIKGLGRQFEQIVSANWIEIWSLRNGDRAVKASVTFTITPNGGTHYTLASRLAFGVRCKHDLKEKCVLIEQ